MLSLGSLVRGGYNSKFLVFALFSLPFYVRNEKSKLILPDINFPVRTTGGPKWPILYRKCIGKSMIFQLFPFATNICTSKDQIVNWKIVYACFKHVVSKIVSETPY